MKIYKFVKNRAVHNIIFIAFVWLAVSYYVDSGILNKDNYGISEEALKWSALNLLIAIFINPFCNFWTEKKPGLEFKEITGLDEYYWAQAQSVVSKSGKEALTILALREGDDILSDNQRKDFRKAYIAAELILKAKDLSS